MPPFRRTGLLILQCNIPVDNIANTFFSIGTVLQFFFIFGIGIGIAKTYIGYRYCQLVYQYQYSSTMNVTNFVFSAYVQKCK